MILNEYEVSKGVEDSISNSWKGEGVFLIIDGGTIFEEVGVYWNGVNLFVVHFLYLWIIEW